MDQEDVNRVLDNVWFQNPHEFCNWLRDIKKTVRILKKADKMISELEDAKVLR